MSDKKREIHPDTVHQLDGYGYKSGSSTRDRPLLICDVDEVVLHLVDPFVQVLSERGFYLKSHSFKLTGNVFDEETDREATQAEVWAGLEQLFLEQSDRQHLVDGAVEGLNQLSQQADIVFLTNMPHDYRDSRIKHLAANGLEFPLVTNSGSKVPAMQMLQLGHSRHVGFIDDTPHNLEQARDEMEGVHLFHFMANDTFRGLVGKIDGTHFSSGDWAQTARDIEAVLTGG